MILLKLCLLRIRIRNCVSRVARVHAREGASHE